MTIQSSPSFSASGTIATYSVTGKNPDGRWRPFTYEELMARDKVNLDIFWLRDESLEDSANLPNPDILAIEIVEDLKSALTQFESIAEELGE
jgi:type I restriction enzyme M protein